MAESSEDLGGSGDGLNNAVYNAGRIVGAYNPLTLVTGAALKAAGAVSSNDSAATLQGEVGSSEQVEGQNSAFSGSPGNPLSSVAAKALSLTSSAGNGGLAGIADGWGVKH